MRFQFLLRALAPCVLWAVVPGCDVVIPEGRYPCTTREQCPSGWVCVSSACYSDPALADGASPTDGGDPPADPGDGGMPDGSPADGGNPTGDGGEPPDDAGGLDAGDGGDEGGEDGGMPDPPCTVMSTFYRDADGDGLGTADDTVMACGEGNGYVDNADDCNDSCQACTRRDAEDVCDGFDNDCDGQTDEGSLEVGAPSRLSMLPDSYWTETVHTDDGTIVFGVVLDEGAVVLAAQRVDADGAPSGDAVTIDGIALPAQLPNFAVAHLDGKIVIAYGEGSGVYATVLNSSDLSVAVAETAISASARSTITLDVAVTDSAFGGRALFLYDTGADIVARPHRLSNLSAEGSVQSVYTRSIPTSFYAAGTVVAAPCLSGFYAAFVDLEDGVLQVVPLGDNGAPRGVRYQVPDVSPEFLTAWPALRVQGGSCSAAPTSLTLAYARNEALLEYGTSRLEVVDLSITRSGAFDDTLTRTGGVTITPDGWVRPVGVALPSGAVFVNRAIDVISHDGRTVLAGMSADADTARGNVQVYEIQDDTVLATHRGPSPPAPAMPQTVQLVQAGDRLWLSTADWTNDAAAGLMPLGCQP